jgi:NAD(P)H-flavin reductase
VGVITTLFPKITVDPQRTVAVIVGPPVMYRFVILETQVKGIPDDRVILSLERRMKCGVGKCGHCQMNHVYVCQEGPVFNYAKIKDLEEAIG